MDNLESNQFSYNDIGIMLGSGADYLNSMRLLLCAIAAYTACYLSALMTAGLLASTLFTWTHKLPQNTGNVTTVGMSNDSRTSILEPNYSTSLHHLFSDVKPSEPLTTITSQSPGAIESSEDRSGDASLPSNFSTKAELYLQLAISRLISSNSAQHCTKMAQVVSEYSPLETPS